MVALKDEVIKRISPNADNTYQITIILRHQANNKSYYAKYYIPKEARHLNKGKVYKIESLSTLVLEDAEERSIRRLIQLQEYMKQDRSFQSQTVKAVFKIFLDDYENRLEAGQDGYSISMLRGYKKTVQRYWLEYLDDNNIIYIDDVRYPHFDDYLLWRKNYWKQYTKKQFSNIPRNGNIRINPSSNTLAWEINSMKAFLKWAKNHRYMFSDVPEYQMKGVIKKSRLAFNQNQWDRLVNYMRTDKFMSDRLKHGFDRRVELTRNQLRCFILLMGHTGLRPGEALQLRWGDLVGINETKGIKTGVLNVKSTHSKVRKNRKVIVLPTGLRAIQRLKQYKEAIQDKYTKSIDYMFVNQEGERLEEMREAFNHVLIDADIGLDGNDDKYVPYSCRHFHISMELRRGTNPLIIAKNCGTSTAMIEQYYDATLVEEHVAEYIQGLPDFVKEYDIQSLEDF
jgi:integrase